MADTHSYDVTIDGETYTVDSDKPLSDVEAYNYAKTQHTAAPFDVKKQNAIMSANMAKQSGGSESPVDAFLRGASGDTTGMTSKLTKVGGAFMTHGPSRLVRGAAGILNTPGVGGEPIQPGEKVPGFQETERNINDVVGGAGLTAAPFIPASIAAAPVTTLASLAGGTAAGAGGAAGATIAGADPDTAELIGNISGIAGGVAGAKTPAAVGRGLVKAGGFVEKSPSTRQMIGSLARKAGEAMTATPSAAVPGLERNLPNTSGAPAVQLYGPSAAGVGVEPPVAVEPHMPNVSAGPQSKFAPAAAPVTPSPIEPHMPNVSQGPEARQLFGPSASGELPSPVDQNTTPPSQTGDTMPAAYRAELLKTLEARRAANNAAFDARAASQDPLSPGATPQKVASKFAASKGLPEPAPHEPVKMDPKLGKKIAEAYDAMKHNPDDPRVKQAYDALAQETKDQFLYVKAHTGLQIEPWTKAGQPYPNSKAMIADVNDNNHMWYFPTEAGGGAASGTAANHPLLAVDEETGMPFNDMLRVVHDYFAHAKGGHQFGPNGEENAFIEHSKLYSPDAMAALASETRGQNSYVNFGPGAHLPPASRPFAPQKAGLLPPVLRGLNPENVTSGISKVDATRMDPAQLAAAGKSAPEPVNGTLPTVQNAVNKLKRGGITVPPDKIKVKNMQVVEPGATTTNASGESAASAESLSRMKAMVAQGKSFAVKKGGTTRILTGPEAVDYEPKPGETYGIIDAEKRFTPLTTAQLLRESLMRRQRQR